MLAVKIRLPLQDEIRRFSIDASTNLEQLTSKLTQFGIHLSSEQQSLIYTDDEGDEVSIRSNEELQEAVALARASTPAILHLSIKKSLKKKFGAPDVAPEAQQAEANHCPFSLCGRWRKNGGRGLRHFARPKCIIGGILGAVVIFKILSLLSCVLGFWPFLILGFLGVRFFVRRHCARRYANGASGCRWAPRNNAGPHQFRSCGFAVSETDDSVPVSSSNTSSTPSQAPVTPVSPAERPSAPSSSSASLSDSGNPENVKAKFESLLNSLAEMGFTDRALNIEKLVANRLNLSATIQSLLN